MKQGASDLRLRRELPGDERLLLEAYEAATKRTVHLDYQRVNVLFALANRSVTQDDIFNVVTYVKRLIRTGENKHKIGKFVPASLEFMNLMGDTSRFCDRLQTAREELAAVRIVKGKRVRTTIQVSENDSVTRFETQKPERAPRELRDNLVDGLKDLIANLQK